jgi:phospholipase/carboxylesterase
MNENQNLTIKKIHQFKGQKSGNTASYMLHGYGATSEDLIGLKDVLDPEKNYNWSFPEGPHPVLMGPYLQGYSWFPLSLAQSVGPLQLKHFTPPGLEALDNALKEMFAKETASKKIIGGFSQGAITAFHYFLSTHDPSISAIIAFSPTFISEKVWVEAMKNHPYPHTPIFIAHGEHDEVLPYSATFELASKLKEHFSSVHFISFKGGHEIPYEVITAAKKFLQQKVETV